jgi:hypothetical protein
MRYYRIILIVSIILLIAALILPVLASHSIPNSIIYWEGYLYFLSPAILLAMLLLLYKIVNFKQLMFISSSFLILLILGLIKNKIGMMFIILYLIGAIGMVLSKKKEANIK